MKKLKTQVRIMKNKRKIKSVNNMKKVADESVCTSVKYEDENEDANANTEKQNEDISFNPNVDPKEQVED